MTQAVVFDIEGTIGDIAFVRTVLFPFARERLAPFLEARWADERVAAIIADAGKASGRQLATPADAVAQFAAWIDEDRKITPLKTLQGMIWRSGYESGAIRAHLYDDAITAMQRFKAQGLRLYIYSSGSIEAQQLYMAHSVAGDVQPLLSGYFDTTTGPKAEPASYTAIARQIGAQPREIVFFSDALAEVQAAQAAGMSAMLLCRDTDQPPAALPTGIRAITSFASLATL